MRPWRCDNQTDHMQDTAGPLGLLGYTAPETRACFMCAGYLHEYSVYNFVLFCGLFVSYVLTGHSLVWSGCMFFVIMYYQKQNYTVVSWLMVDRDDDYPIISHISSTINIDSKRPQ